MQYHCKICGEAVDSLAKECPNCHTPIGPSTIIEGAHAPVVSASAPSCVTAVVGRGGSGEGVGGCRPCPRCGEMLMPGVNVCEFCGEVLVPPGRNDSSLKTTAIATATLEERDVAELPKVINTGKRTSAVSPPVITADRNATTRVAAPDSGRQGQVTVGMLVIICVMVALIAAVITWAVIHFTRAAHAEKGQNEYVADQTDYAGANTDIGVEEAVAPSPLPEPRPAVEMMPDPDAAVTDGNNVPIDGMTESLAGSWTFYGKVNNKFGIGIDMKIEPDGTMSGCYWYDSTLRQNGDEPSTYINLEGEVDDTGRVKLTAFKYGENKPSEHWTGRLSGVTPLKFVGSFRSVTNGTNYTFSTATR